MAHPVCLFLAASCAVTAAYGRTGDKNPLLRVEADFIAFSFDHNQFLAQNASFDLPPGRRVACRTLQADLAGRAFLALGGVTLAGPGESLRGDSFAFDPATGAGVLTSYGETVERSEVRGTSGPAPPAEKTAAAEAVTAARIRGSLLYAVCRSLDVSPSFEAFGRDVVLFVEGLESVGFTSLKLSVADAAGARRDGLALNKLWYYRNRGLQARASYSVLDPGRTDSLTQLEYEEHSFVRDFPGPPRQADLRTTNAWTLGPVLSLGLEGNANTSGLFNARLWLGKDWPGKKIATVWDLTYSRPVGRPEEKWLGLKASFDAGAAGTLKLGGRYELGGQASGEMTYSAPLGESFNLEVSSAYSRLKRGFSGAFSEILVGKARLAYTSRLFNLATDYHLNADLAEGRSLRSPQLRLELNPLPLYGGLLLARLSNVFIHNVTAGRDTASTSYSNNTALGLSAVPFSLRPGLTLDFTLALEQFLEKAGRNFTSGGVVLNLKREWGRALSLEGFYSLQSRRRTRGGLLEGTTSQDLSSVLRFEPGERIGGWLSISYDPKNGRFKQSFADLTLAVLRGWRFHSLLQYDFVLGRFPNVDLYLIRDAGRFELRFIWRSLSRQVLVELVPK